MTDITCPHCETVFFAPPWESPLWDGGILCADCKEVIGLDDVGK